MKQQDASLGRKSAGACGEARAGHDGGAVSAMIGDCGVCLLDGPVADRGRVELALQHDPDTGLGGNHVRALVA